MNIHQWLKSATTKLADAGIDTARLDAELLLAEALGKNRLWIHTHPDENITELSLQIPARGLASSRYLLEELGDMLQRRVSHEPVAYIIGKKEFYGRVFTVTKDTLTPRPETETMVEVVTQLVKTRMYNAKNTSIIDVGTGTGCIIVSLAKELALNNVQFFATDISDPAISVAQKNADDHIVNVRIKKQDLLAEMSAEMSGTIVITANLPYVPADYPINQAATHEPSIALFSGEDGLDHYGRLFKQISDLPNDTYVATEALMDQHESLTEIASQSGYLLASSKDLIQLFKKNKQCYKLSGTGSNVT